MTRYEHNAVGRLIARHLPATACAPAITEHFAWRADGQLASFTSPTAEVRFAFDAAGRVLRESQSHTDQRADPWHYACAHHHGLLGQLSRSALATPHAEPLIREYAYDAHAHLASIRQRDGAGTRAIAYAYDASGRLIASQHGAQRHDYRFDPAGNRLDVTAPDGTLSAPADDDWARTVARNCQW